MNLKEIKDLIGLMNENDLTEIEVEREGSKIKLKKSSSDYIEPLSPRPISYQVDSQSSAAQSPEASSKKTDSNSKEIQSPMVGTFYRAASPDSPPFIDVGQVVEVGQVVCIVEAMKLMNEIKSEVKGKVVEVLVENAQPVEFGQALIRVEQI